MTYAPTDLLSDSDTTSRLPPWAAARRAGAPEDAAFSSGAALAHLHHVLARPDLPHALLRDRLALRAAEACVIFAGRPERASELRDAVQFLQPPHRAGPAGEIYLAWRRSVARPISIMALNREMPGIEAAQIAAWLYAGAGGPVARAAAVLEVVLRDDPRALSPALLLAETALAQALGWSHAVPCLAPGLRPGDLRKTGEDLRVACYRAVCVTAELTTRDASDLTRRAARLREVVPKLRARGAEEAAALFLARDAVAATALTSLRSDRAARRFCDRLVELGAVREMTGRDTFRLYGV